MNNNNFICKCDHPKKLHTNFGSYKPCSYGYDRISATVRKPFQYLVCSCQEFRADNLRYLEELSK